MTQPSPHLRFNLFRSFVLFLLSLSVIVAPVTAAALLPLGPSLAAETALILAVPVTAYFGQQRVARFISEWAGWAMFGLGVSLWRAFPAWWGAVAGVVLALVGFDLLQSLEDRLKLTLPRGGNPGDGRPDAFYSQLRTPEGGAIRVLDEGESGRMGGPIVRTILFDDGVLLSGVGLIGRFSRDARYFAVVVPQHNDYDDLLVLDRHDKTLRSGPDTSAFWSIAEFGQPVPGTSLPGGRRWLGRTLFRSRKPSIWWGDFLVRHAPEQLELFQDLWLSGSGWHYFIEQWHTSHTIPSGDNQHRLTARATIPASFSTLDRPLETLHYPLFHLFLDDQDTGLTTYNPTSGCWSDDSRVCCCRAIGAAHPDGTAPLDGTTHMFWWWKEHNGWNQMPDFETLGGSDPRLETANAAVPVGNELQLDTFMDTIELNHGRFGTSAMSRSQAIEVPNGTNAAGELNPRTLHRRRVTLCSQMEPEHGARLQKRVVSGSLVGDQPVVFVWDHDGDHGLSAWRCRIGDWQLPDLWLLDHKCFDDGQGVVLCPFTEDLPLAGSFVVALVQGRQLLHGPNLLVHGVHDAFQGEVSVIELAGRIDSSKDDAVAGTLLAPFDTAAPQPGQAQGFLALGSARYFYQIRRFHLADGQLIPVPVWRTVNGPQACTAEGDFVYPAPGNGVLNAAWYFGGGGAYGRGWPRREEPRTHGFVMTAHGYAMGNLASAMIWSDDGKFLVLTRQDPKHSWRWSLLLLDQTYGLLHVGTKPLMGMPCFERFDREGVSFTLVDQGWHDSKITRTRHHLSMAELTAMPGQTMVEGNAMRLEAAQAKNRLWWEKLDTAPLAPYRSPR